MKFLFLICFYCISDSYENNADVYVSVINGSRVPTLHLKDVASVFVKTQNGASSFLAAADTMAATCSLLYGSDICSHTRCANKQRESNNKTFFISFSHIRVCVCVSTKKHKATEEVLDLLECAFVIPWLLNAVSSLLVSVKTKKIKKTNSFSALSLPR